MIGFADESQLDRFRILVEISEDGKDISLG